MSFLWLTCDVCSSILTCDCVAMGGGVGWGLRLCLFMVGGLCDEAAGTYYVNNYDLRKLVHTFLWFCFV